MVQKFCEQCGSPLKENSRFCVKCGAQVLSESQIIYVNNRKIPGRGYGISSMVLGIIGCFYLFVQLLNIISAISLESLSLDIDLIILALNVTLYAVLSLLALIFGILARKRKYQCGISSSGIVLGVLGMAIAVISLIMVAANI
ncbi:MAG: zinc ribbon domain-containing protein [Oscillospiraceae bacterium]|nr:zinc ribbon domain-containing protein [Oscillospiraceae bacterium]